MLMLFEEMRDGDHRNGNQPSFGVLENDIVGWAEMYRAVTRERRLRRCGCSARTALRLLDGDWDGRGPAGAAADADPDGDGMLYGDRHRDAAFNRINFLFSSYVKFVPVR